MPKADRLSPGAIALLKEKQIAHLVTLNRHGSPQITPLWVDVEEDGSHILVNTSEGRVKTNNITRDPRVAIQVVDSQNTQRAVSVTGRVVGVSKEGAIDHINKLAQKYRGGPYPFREPGEAEKRVIVRIQPQWVVERGLSR
jgi:PPOX class probable F420-dependent enzyme